MSKRIYVGDPRKLNDLARQTGISAEKLRQASAGRIELTDDEIRKINSALKISEARPRQD